MWQTMNRIWQVINMKVTTLLGEVAYVEKGIRDPELRQEFEDGVERKLHELERLVARMRTEWDNREERDTQRKQK